VAQRLDGQYVWVQQVAIARTVGVSDAQFAALERHEAPSDLFTERERMAFVFADEVADAVVWLCSDAASFFTGHVMPVDGGWVAQ